MPLSLDISMLKSSQLQGGFASQPLIRGSVAGGSAPDPHYVLNAEPHSCIWVGGLQLSSAGTVVDCWYN